METCIFHIDHTVSVLTINFVHLLYGQQVFYFL